ncbi:MAG: LamG-like jellyroll fold domain-containing protein [Candidatus Neomarinimicrobiota bacterium]|jgi:hypothetical protein|nr:T9SS type A sorting domain-containing protein [Candidatus Neomarinimicrobiota bacterium]MDD3966995.1 T9SS type A sorting domain-containing protein [Candidatus Neomarinimicrobiota bacterium]MDX9780262.1 LamG-like jellyroll fold domain-containing protein [bacterium]
MKHYAFIFPLLLAAAFLAAEDEPMCLEFNGIDQYVLINNSSLNLNRYMTLECWFRVDDFIPDAALIDNGKSAENGSYWGYGIFCGDPGSIYVRIGNGLTDSVISIGNIPSARWQHLALTYDRFKKNENFVLLINGKVCAKGNFSTAIAYPPYMNNYGLFLGKSYDGFRNAFFRGALDELRIWSRVLSNKEILQNMCSAPDSLENTLLAYYDFNQADSSTVYDLSGKGNHGTLVNFPDSLRPFSYAQLMPMQPDDVGFDRIVLHWQASGDFDSYTVDFSSDSTFSSSLPGFPVEDILTNYYIMDNLDPGAYYFRLKGHYVSQDPETEPWSMPILTATVSDAATPVRLSRFTAEMRNNTVLISWITESQIEHACFRLQRCSEDGGWITLSDIPGAGTSSEPENYHYTDCAVVPGGTYRYRLLNIAYSGASDSSGVCGVTVPELQTASAENVFLQSVFPNPFNPQTRIRINLMREEHVSIRIFSADGKCKARLCDRRLQPGGHSFIWDPQELPAGIYMLNLRSGSFSVSRKILYIK